MAVALTTLANALRALSMDAVEAARSGHPGMPMGMADVAACLFAERLKFDAAAPDWADRDRFILSAGHGSMLLYALLHLTGYEDAPLEEIKRFRQLGARMAGHPEFGHLAGVETTTGPLGQGLANAVGFAMAERALAARFGSGLVDHRTWVIAGDGCLMEGISQEAISLAGRHRLDKLIVLWDDNAISIDGAVDLADATDQRARFEACGWRVLACDGHDPAAISAALAHAAEPAGKPTLVACKTVIGFGAPKKAGTAAAHGEPLGGEELAAAKAALGWPHGPFEIPQEVAAAWRAIGARGAQLRAAWEQRLAASPEREAFLAAMRGETPPAAMEALKAHKAALLEKPPAIATRAASGLVLEALAPVLPSLFGGSADLSKSNVTQAKAMTDFTPENPSGRYVRYGVREHGMAAAMNGMALHGGLIPYGGTFLCFADYARPSLRLAALMGVRTIHVMTHDSIGLGEDGPTHQPVEHLASLRAIPNLYVFRPADALETAECWEAALALRRSPSVLALSRQAAPALRVQASAENLSARGAYELAPAEGGPSRAALFATGTEVALAMAARTMLQAEGVPTRVVSCPCFELFEEQDDSYRDRILGPVQEVRFGVEAAIAQGWIEAFELDGFLGMSEFGASGPAPELYQHFGLTAEALAEGVRELLALTGEEIEA